jgi:chromosome segregation ATPase
MNESTIYGVVFALVTGVLGLLGGSFGSKLLDRGAERDKARDRAADEARGATLADNEHARRWYGKELDERDTELRGMRDHERELTSQVADLAARLARHEERATAQAVQIEEMKRQIAEWHHTYDEIKAERNQYRDRSHDLANQLTPLLGRMQLAERELAARDEEIARLKGQLAAVTGSKEGS